MDVISCDYVWTLNHTRFEQTDDTCKGRLHKYFKTKKVIGYSNPFDFRVRLTVIACAIVIHSHLYEGSAWGGSERL